MCRYTSIKYRSQKNFTHLPYYPIEMRFVTEMQYSYSKRKATWDHRHPQRAHVHALHRYGNLFTNKKAVITPIHVFGRVSVDLTSCWVNYLISDSLRHSFPVQLCYGASQINTCLLQQLHIQAGVHCVLISIFVLGKHRKHITPNEDFRGLLFLYVAKTKKNKAHALSPLLSRYAFQLFIHRWLVGWLIG